MIPATREAEAGGFLWAKHLRLQCTLIPSLADSERLRFDFFNYKGNINMRLIIHVKVKHVRKINQNMEVKYNYIMSFVFRTFYVKSYNVTW